MPRPPRALSRIFERYCDPDKAARRWKAAYAFSTAAWAVKAVVVVGGSADLYLHFQSVHDPARGIFQTIAQNPQLSIKFIAYEAVWATLFALRWGSAGYGTFGLVHARRRRRAEKAPQAQAGANSLGAKPEVL